MSGLKRAFAAKGYDQLDLLEVKSESRGFSYEVGEGYRLKKADDFGVGVRAVVKSKVGHAFANRYEDLPSAVKNAIKFAKYSNISFDLAKFEPYKKPAKTYDSGLMKRDDNDFLEQLKGIIGATHNEKCSVVAAGNSACKGYARYINSEGVDVSEKSTGFGVEWELEHKKNPCTYVVEDTHFVSNISKELARTCELARLQTKKLDVKTSVKPVIFHHYIFPDLITYGFVPALSSRMVQQGQSKLAKRMGEKVFSDKLSIVDNGLLRGGLASGKFDAEGVPRQRTSLVEKGVLKGFLYDLARAKKDGVESTGNGARGYSSAATVSPTNFVVKKGRKDVVREIDDGVLVYSALNTHSADFISGDFSVGAFPAFVIKKGELVGSPKKLMLSGNMYELLANIKAVGRDAVSLAGGIHGSATIVTPSVLSECLVIGE